MPADDATSEIRGALRAAAQSGRPWGYWRAPGEPGRVVSTLRTIVFPHSSAAVPSIATSTYRDRVRGALRAIDAGLVEKVVVARVEHYPPADPVATLLDLERRFPSCWVFATSDGVETFLGATPELLVSVRGRELVTCALAGTSAVGDDRLLTDDKELREHQHVVDAVRASLAPWCDDLEIAPTPRLMVLPNVQHLHTPVRATLRDGVDPEDVVRALHPTPAVCGTPREAALKLIDELEPFERGLYAGVVGLLDGDDADWVVAIRSARLCADATYVYAGAGIVAGSQPDTEDRETLAKMTAVTESLRMR